MTKTFKYYSVIWAICFVIFNILTFVSPIRINVISGNFLIGYLFIILAFIGQLVCSYKAFNETNIKKMFYNTSLVLISYICFGVMLIVGSLCMIFPILPMSIGISVSVIVTGIFAILVVTTCYVIDVVSNIDDEVINKTNAMKSLTTNSEHLMEIANSDEMKVLCKKVYESFKYSDIVSDNSLKEINEQIQRQFISFENAVNNKDLELAENISNELISLINKRNKQCKLLK